MTISATVTASDANNNYWQLAPGIPSTSTDQVTANYNAGAQQWEIQLTQSSAGIGFAAIPVPHAPGAILTMTLAISNTTVVFTASDGATHTFPLPTTFAPLSVIIFCKSSNGTVPAELHALQGTIP